MIQYGVSEVSFLLGAFTKFYSIVMLICIVSRGAV